MINEEVLLLASLRTTDLKGRVGTRTFGTLSAEVRICSHYIAGDAGSPPGSHFECVSGSLD